MLVGKKASSRRSNFDFRHQSAYSESKEPRLPPSFEGFIFICSNDTEPDLERKIFGVKFYDCAHMRLTDAAFQQLVFTSNVIKWHKE
ncbi:hypothetical protein KP509_1Z051200 [Ceratopteris richardii]|nr:hypothetical protein KP509_1Z051200 [Ceratopteris richardii]